MHEPLHENDLEWRDYIFYNDDFLYPSSLQEKFKAIRLKVFDLPIRQTPIKRESDYVIHPDQLSESEKYRLNHEEYDLDTPTADNRIHNQFQYFTYLLNGIGNSISVLDRERRAITQMKNDVEEQYQRQLSYAFMTYGKGSIKDGHIGTSKEERDIWMRATYPALCAIRSLCKGFLEEMSIEYDRLKVMQDTASRSLTGLDQDAKMRGEYVWNPQDRRR